MRKVDFRVVPTSSLSSFFHEPLVPVKLEFDGEIDPNLVTKLKESGYLANIIIKVGICIFIHVDRGEGLLLENGALPDKIRDIFSGYDCTINNQESKKVDDLVQLAT